jgi:HPt (histidine-containing phosphotransfer) domain-containing protein
MCLQAGMDAYLTKPIRPQALDEVLAELSPQAPRTEDRESPSAPPSPPGLVDWAGALERVRGQTAFLKRMVGLFVQESGRQMPAIRSAIDRNDGPTLRRLAHTLKGSADLFGAALTVEAAQKLEFMARDGIWEGIEQAWADLERELARLIPALETHAREEAGP